MIREGRPGPLAGVRVLDLTRYHAGSFCGLMLSRLGADVIKVEPPEGEVSRSVGPMVRGQSVYWVQFNAGKRSLGLNLSSDKGKDILRRLVALSDVFVENFRPGVIGAMGFDYPSLKAMNQRIVSVNISGYGQYGPYRDRPGDDRVALALAGFMLDSGDEGDPPQLAGETVAEHMTAMSATIGAIAALGEAHLSGEGQSVDVALADSAYSMMGNPISYYKSTGKVPPRGGNPVGSGFTRFFKCTDGLVLLYGNQRDYRVHVCKTIGHPEWIEEGGIAFRNDPKSVSVVEKGLEEWFGQRTSKEAVSTLGSGEGVPVAPINTVTRAAEDPHPWARDVLVEVPDPIAGKLHVIGNLMHYSRSGYHVGPAPTPGQHTQEILTELLGMSEAALRQLKKEKVI